MSKAYGSFDDFSQLRAPCLHDSLEVAQGLAGLCLDVAFADKFSLSIEGDASGQKEKVSGFDCLRVGPDGCWGVWSPSKLRN